MPIWAGVEDFVIIRAVPGQGRPYRSTSPASYAAITRCVRSRTPNFVRSLPTWVLAVAADMCKVTPISALDRPRATATRTSISRAVKEFNHVGFPAAGGASTYAEHQH